jgi:hypothetical protein
MGLVPGDIRREQITLQETGNWDTGKLRAPGQIFLEEPNVEFTTQNSNG